MVRTLDPALMPRDALAGALGGAHVGATGGGGARDAYRGGGGVFTRGSSPISPARACTRTVTLQAGAPARACTRTVKLRRQPTLLHALLHGRAW
jgi:hypothetical protein